MQCKELGRAARGRACVDARLSTGVHAVEADKDCRGRSAGCGSFEHAQSVEHRTSGGCGKRACKRCARRTDSLGESGGGSDCGSPTAIDSRSCKCGRLRGWRTKHSRGSQGPRGCGSHWVPRRRLRAGVCVGSLMENRKQQSGIDSVHDTSVFSCGLFVTVAAILAGAALALPPGMGMSRMVFPGAERVALAVLVLGASGVPLATLRNRAVGTPLGVVAGCLRRALVQ